MGKTNGSARVLNLAVDSMPDGTLRIYSASGEYGKHLERELGPDYLRIQEHTLQVLTRVINASWDDVKKLKEQSRY